LGLVPLFSVRGRERWRVRDDSPGPTAAEVFAFPLLGLVPLFSVRGRERLRVRDDNPGPTAAEVFAFPLLGLVPLFSVRGRERLRVRDDSPGPTAGDARGRLREKAKRIAPTLTGPSCKASRDTPHRRGRRITATTITTAARSRNRMILSGILVIPASQLETEKMLLGSEGMAHRGGCAAPSATAREGEG
jgi:hypothetical protein